MTTMQFRPAQRKKTKLRMAIDGPAGAGKTFTALRFAFALGQRVAVIDTEAGSAAKYEGESPDGTPWRFDVLELTDFSPLSYVKAIAAAIGRYDVLVIDSLSHAWAGPGGALELVDQKTKAANSKNAFTSGWRDVTPMHNQLVEALLHCPMHLICTMRSKMGYVVENNVPKKVGLEPIQRNGMEYEFDVLGDINLDHGILFSKSRCSAIDQKYAEKPNAATIAPLVHWLNEGADVPQEIIDAAGFMERVQHVSATSATVDKPRKSAEQIAKEAAERAAKKTEKKEESAAETKPATPVQSATAPVPADAPCSAADSEAIKNLFITLGMTHEQQTKALAKRGAQAVRNLTAAQAAELLAALEAKAVAAAKVAETSPVTTNISAAVADTEPCTPDQVATIKGLLSSLGDPELVARIKAKLNAVNLTLAQLCWRDANKLEQALRAKEMEAFFAANLEAAAVENAPFDASDPPAVGDVAGESDPAKN